MKKNGLHPRSTEAWARNTLLRLVNVIFSSCFIDRFLSLNDAKSRMDHETGQLCKNFWEDAAECHNDFDDINNSELLIINNNNDDDFDALMKREVILVNLEDADNMTAETLCKKVMTMIKVRRAIKQNMQVSGTHSNRVLDFLDVVDVAINKTKGARMLNRLGVYYFYI